MPLYEYECHRCGHRFEILVYGQIRPICPKCQGNDLLRVVSTFATSGGGKRDGCFSRTSSGGCGPTGGG